MKLNSICHSRVKYSTSNCFAKGKIDVRNSVFDTYSIGTVIHGMEHGVTYFEVFTEPVKNVASNKVLVIFFPSKGKILLGYFIPVGDKLVVSVTAHIGHLLAILVYPEGSLPDGDFFGFT